LLKTASARHEPMEQGAARPRYVERRLRVPRLNAW
jgi:hypothetical protein